MVKVVVTMDDCVDATIIPADGSTTSEYGRNFKSTVVMAMP